jgi:hypothetical protein
VGESVVVDGERDPGVFGQRLQLRRPGWRGQYKLASVPVEPDGDDARRPVGPEIGEPGGDLRLQKFTGRGMLQQFKGLPV